jgi:sugar lactone lactonase YvrE
MPAMHRLISTLAVILLVPVASGTQVKSFASANVVLGQQGFDTANAPIPPSASSLNSPNAVAVDPATGKVFVCDTRNNRVLRFASASALTSGAEAEIVFGQTDFSGNGAPTAGASTLASPAGIWIDSGGRLWISDSGNNRVAMYANASTIATNAAPATLVLGQPGVSGRSPAASQAGMSQPEGLCVDANGVLWVADSGNNRVLRFDHAAAKTIGANADGVLGQQTFTTATPGTGNQQLSSPTGVTMDVTGTLWVADSANNRIFGYPAAATISNGTNAARVLGQPDFNVTSSGCSASRINAPTAVFADGGSNLWVVDTGNHRVLRFANLKSIENGSAASDVIGQVDFTSARSDLVDSQHLSNPRGISEESNHRLWIADTGHNRVLDFEPTDSEAPTITITGRRKFMTRLHSIVLHGTATDDVAVTAVTVKVGRKGSRPASGAGQWFLRIHLLPGRNVIQVLSYDAVGHISAPARAIIVRE